MSKFAILLVAALLAGLSAFAQDSNPPASAPKHSHSQSDRAEQRLKRLSRKLNLTDDQKEKIRPILEDEEKQLSSLDSDSTMTPQQKHRKTRELRMSAKSQMEGILTPEQKEKLPAGRAHGEGHHRMAPGKANTGTGTADTGDNQ